MNGIVHPFTGALYERDDDGSVRVTHDGRWGRFTGHGRWIEGEIEEADPHLCGWVHGPRIANHRVAKQSRTG